MKSLVSSLLSSNYLIYCLYFAFSSFFRLHVYSSYILFWHEILSSCDTWAAALCVSHMYSMYSAAESERRRVENWGYGEKKEGFMCLWSMSACDLFIYIFFGRSSSSWVTWGAPHSLIHSPSIPYDMVNKKSTISVPCHPGKQNKESSGFSYPSSRNSFQGAEITFLTTTSWSLWLIFRTHTTHTHHNHSRWEEGFLCM